MESFVLCRDRRLCFRRKYPRVYIQPKERLESKAMGKAKRKKTSCFENKMLKSVILTGEPNKWKSDSLSAIQGGYTSEVSRFIGLIHGAKELVLPLSKGARVSPECRAFEKENRSDALTSAYSQSAFDMAFDHLHNRITEIRHELYGILPCPMTSSAALFGMTLARATREDMAGWLSSMSEPGKRNRGFYESLLEGLGGVEDFDFACEEIRALYGFLDEEKKLPRVKRARARLVSTLFNLGETEGIKAPCLIEITKPASKGNQRW